jgi:hypothetical protein
MDEEECCFEDQEAVVAEAKFPHSEELKMAALAGVLRSVLCLSPRMRGGGLKMILMNSVVAMQLTL